MSLIEEIQRSLGTSYVVERELGGGGMSRVFLARDTRLNRGVVVKILSGEFSASLSSERFEREIQLSAALQHPHIVSVLSAGDAGGMPYYIMPFIEGESLRSKLSAGPIPIDLGLSILRDVLRALGFAHGRGVVHRDIKPENVLLSGGSAVVSDFGIGKAISAARGDTTDTALTREGIALGTPAYMSPEQATGAPVDHRADIYSWGIVAYETLSSRHPFGEKASVSKMIAAHIAETPPPLGMVAPHVPADVCAIVMQCLAKDPQDRPDSALGLLDLLTHVTTSSPGIRVFPSRVRRIMPVVALGIATIAIALAVTRERETPPTDARSVAVLPFDVVGGDTTDTYFAEGMADELTSVLSR
ncbi:MAG: serine/threonine-protein kinase, partial [Gemmatimonas sp.]